MNTTITMENLAMAWNGYHVAGEKYPRLQLRVSKENGGYFIIDETGWNGFCIEEPTVISTSYPDAEAALEAIDTVCDLLPEMEGWE